MVTVDEIVDLLEAGVVRHIAGRREAAVSRPASVLPGAAGALSFCKFHGDQLRSALASTASSVVLVPEDHELPDDPEPHLLVVANPRTEFMRVLGRFFAAERAVGIHPSAVLHPAAVVGPDCYVGPNAHVGRATLGARCHISANVVILDHVRMGDDVTIGPSTTIGYTGFGYGRADNGQPVPFPHYGGVVIGNRVDIGANTAIDRGTLDDTVLEDDCKVDNLVHVAHNVRICSGAFVIACTILSGGVTVGRNAWVAPNSSVREQLTIGEGATVGLAATVVKDVEPGTVVVGSPARPLPPRP